MATIKDRIIQLEQASNNAPMLVLSVTDRPTPEQAERINRRLIVFYMPSDTAWMSCTGVPPWDEKGEYGNA